MTPKTVQRRNPTSIKVIKNDSAEQTNTMTCLKLNRNHLPFMHLSVNVLGEWEYLSKPVHKGADDVGEQIQPIWANCFIFLQCCSLKLIYSFIQLYFELISYI